MKVEFSIDGGLASFPGLRAPVTIDAATLPQSQGDHLRALMTRARFFDVAPPAPVGARDGRCYTIAVDDAGRCRTLKLFEPIANPALRELVAELAARASAQRRDRA